MDFLLTIENSCFNLFWLRHLNFALALKAIFAVRFLSTSVTLILSNHLISFAITLSQILTSELFAQFMIASLFCVLSTNSRLHIRVSFIFLGHPPLPLLS